MPTVRLDFFLDPAARLTEQERALITAMLSDLVASLADELKAMLAGAEPANDQSDHLFDRLWAAGLLDVPAVIGLLLRRSEEERIAAAIRASGADGKPRFLQSLVSDEDPAVSGAAMTLILARGRRRDRFDGPRVAFDDLSAEAAVTLVNAVAAALRSDLASRLGASEADERLTGAVRGLLATHDEGKRLEARLFDLVHALDGADRLDDRLIRSALNEADIALVLEALARRAGIGFDSAWDHLTGGGGRPGMLLRMAAVPRDLAAEIIGSLAEIIGSDAETEIDAFDQAGDEDVESARKWLRLDDDYRAAIRALSAEDGKRAV